MVDHDSVLRLMSNGVTQKFPELVLIFYRSADRIGYDLIISDIKKPGIYSRSQVSEVFLHSNPRRVFEDVVMPMAQKVYAKEYSKLANILRGKE